MAKRKEAEVKPIENGQLWQVTKNSKKQLEVLNVEPLRLLNKLTGKTIDSMTPDDLRARAKLVGVHVPQDGEAKALTLDRVGSAPSSVIRIGQVWALDDDPSDKITITGPAPKKAGNWIVWEHQNNREATIPTTTILANHVLEKDAPDAPATGPKLEVVRTENPADPALTETGVEEADEDEDEPTDGQRSAMEADCGDEHIVLTPNERVIIDVMRGKLRTIDVEYKAKELRLFCQSKNGSIIKADDLQDMLEEAAQEILIRWKNVSAEPKPGEIPFQGHIAPTPIPVTAPPKVDAAPTSEPAKTPAEAPVPAAPVNGSEPPAVSA